MGSDLLACVPSFNRHLRALNRAERTVCGYGDAVRRLVAHLPDVTRSGGFAEVSDWGDVTQNHLEEYIGGIARDHSAGYANNQYRALQQWFKWLAAEEEIFVDPMKRMRPPTPKPKLMYVLSLDECRRLIGVCRPKGRRREPGRNLWADGEFVNRRDEALIRLWLDTGVRRAEMRGLQLTDLNLDTRRALVTGKGGKQRIVRFGRQTASALDRYLRVRRRHKMSDLPWMWLGEKNRGPLTNSGLYQVVVRRAASVGIQMHPHTFRHTFSHYYRASGGGDDDLMELNGWSTRAMLSLYGKSVAAERALTAYDRHSIGDQL